MSNEEIIIYTLSGITALLIVWIVRLEIKIKSIPSVKLNQHLNNQINILQKNIAELFEFKSNTGEQFKKAGIELSKRIGGIETIRFNPFKSDGVGGNQSFATALVDDEGNGVIISSLYSRERVSVFAKPVKNWTCEHELSGEEKEVLEKVKNKKRI
ncbi:DUF4446 family protein [Patescibacteria group bacterium]|nr:DUF4446 family protein [Patescibacteria group bacterium]MCG2694474.1 DUF4446 family protein [Candidatus Parcubacteria bacterium]